MPRITKQPRHTRQSKKPATPPLLSARWAFAILMGLTGLAGLLYLYITVDFSHLYTTYRDATYAHVGKLLRLNVQVITIDGAVHTQKNTIKKALGFGINDPMMSLDIKATHQNLENLVWIKHAQIERTFPGTIRITIHERVPLALWQHHNKLHLIDAHGEIINVSATKPFHNLPHILGGKAPRHANDLIVKLHKHPEILKILVACAHIDERRWDLIVAKKIRVKLPEKNVSAALKHLAQMVQDGYIAEGSVLSVDLRVPERTYFQLSPKAFATQTKRTGNFT